MTVVVIGAGIVGAACAHALTRAGAEVVVVDRGPAASGTTSRGEGNILVSDKGPGAELDLARLSRDAWLEVGDEVGRDEIELEEKGGVVVASSEEALGALRSFAERQRSSGTVALDVAEPRELEPHLSPGVAGGVLYPEDMQVQPVLAAAALIEAAQRRGARFLPGTEVVGPVLDGGRLAGVRTSTGEVIGADAVVNAAGTWGGDIGERLGGPVPVLPRRGFILVTEPLPPMVRHKVYSADYVANVSSSASGLETSCVVEGTRGGTILIGASRERVGFDATLDVDVVSTLARQAVDLFPFLDRVNLLRVYRGFRPYAPDHLPIVGPDPRVPGLFHACGHEGAGIGLAPGTGLLIADQVLGLGQGHAERFAELLPARFVDGEVVA